MSKFKIGDRVKYVGCNISLKGKIGTILTMPCSHNAIGVVFDSRASFLHHLGGLCKEKNGWWCDDSDLELISEHRFNLIITSVGDTTTAKLLHGKKVEKEVSVKRYHKDVYSEEAAVESVCKKLFGKDKPKAAAEPEGINCKAVCLYNCNIDTYNIDEINLTRGKIYEFSDGRCVDNREEWYPASHSPKITHFDDPRFKNLFVKLVEDDE